MNAKHHTPDDSEKVIKNPFYFGSYKSAYYRKLQIEFKSGDPINHNFDAFVNVRVKIMLPNVTAKRGFSIKWKENLVSEFLISAKLFRGSTELQSISGNFIKFHRGMLCSADDLIRYECQENTDQTWVIDLKSRELSIELPFTFTRDTGYALFGYDRQDKYRIDLNVNSNIEDLLDIIENKYNIDGEIKRQTIITDNKIETLSLYDWDIIPSPTISADIVDKFNDLDKTALSMDRRSTLTDSSKFLETSEPDGIMHINSNCHTLVIYCEDEVEQVEIHDSDNNHQIFSGNDLKCYYPLKTFKRKPSKNFYGWSNALNYRELLSIKPNVSLTFIKVTTRNQKPVKVLALTTI